MLRPSSLFLPLLLLAGFPLADATKGAPLPKPSAASSRFTFVAYGDTRSQPEEHRIVIAEIIRLHPEFVLQSGDLVDHGRKEAEWQEFDAITQPLRDARIAYYPARGNHDLGPYYAAHVTQPFDSGNKYYYAFTRHRNRFIIVDNFQDYMPGSVQYRWLETELARAGKMAVNTFVMFHESPYSIGPHGPNPEAQKNLHPLFVKYRPRAVFCGHDHLYYRTVRDGVLYIVTGGGGAPPYRPENEAVAIPGDVYVHDRDSQGQPLSGSDYDAKIYHAILCQVDGSRVTFTAINTHGVVLDKFTAGPK